MTEAETQRERSIRGCIYVSDSVKGAIELTDPQIEALVILLAVISESIHIGKRNDLRSKQVNSQAFRVLRDHGLGCYEYDTFAGETHVYASCTDKALLNAMEHTPWLAAKVKVAEATLAQEG